MNQALGRALGTSLAVLGSAIGFFELENVSVFLSGSLFERWFLLFGLGYIGTVLVVVATWRSRSVEIGGKSLRSVMTTNALEIAAFIVMAIAVLTGLNDDKTHVFGTIGPFLAGGLAAVTFASLSAGLILAGALLITRSLHKAVKEGDDQ